MHLCYLCVRHLCSTCKDFLSVASCYPVFGYIYRETARGWDRSSSAWCDIYIPVRLPYLKRIQNNLESFYRFYFLRSSLPYLCGSAEDECLCFAAVDTAQA